ncbi:MAG: 50S ribosomal protein L18 [Thaumarchaeota archaeon 13_1_40CM_38_12]|nr:MAG: 50S ribosomal protein L18 [Thaumarchaeota archaeon 13_1_40CM_38_12]OLC33823.1 MAG: 50S ribosomal protein L18 [Thaumarchaeota archaeon 13_1_40CM_4_38_7]OLC92037.1 MAG: 50S ribosomal protein L18 [Thaumarchaeota archaeon 13_1_40CM_3_38_6]OLD29743.1 MAG: 50S ribosomal protein L18 [Thaumarchaeota archaeon 13_1_40CM_2_39_7]
MAKQLRGASKKNNAPIWLKLAELALKPSRSRRVINLGQLDKFVNDNDVVVVPGKVLGTGNISHKITLCSFSISTTGAKKVTQSGGKLVDFAHLIKNHPTGKGVKIIG